MPKTSCSSTISRNMHSALTLRYNWGQHYQVARSTCQYKQSMLKTPVASSQHLPCIYQSGDEAPVEVPSLLNLAVAFGCIRIADCDFSFSALYIIVLALAQPPAHRTP